MWVCLWAELTAGTSMSQRMMGGVGGGAKLLTWVSALMQLLTSEPGDEIHVDIFTALWLKYMKSDFILYISKQKKLKQKNNA